MKRSALSVVAWAPGRLDVFGVGLDNAIFHKSWDSGGWQPTYPNWERIGGTSTSAPAVVSWGPGRLDVVTLGANKEMIHKAWDNGWGEWRPSQTGWDSLGGAFIRNPVVVSWGSNHLEIFCVGSNGAVYAKRWAGGWKPAGIEWKPLGGALVSAPAAVARAPNRLDVFHVGRDGHAYHKSWNGTKWEPSDAGWNPLGGDFKSDLAVVSWAEDKLDVFGVGDGGQVLHREFDGSGWKPASGWEDLGGKCTSAPVATCWGGKRIDLFVVGQTEDAGLYHKGWNGSWSPPGKGWRPLSGVLTSRPAAVSWGPNRLDVVSLGTDVHAYHKAWNGKWLPDENGPWEKLGGIFRLPAQVTVAPPPRESRWAVLTCKFKDDLSEPISRLKYLHIFTRAGDGTPGMTEYFSAISHDRLDMSRTDVFGPYVFDKVRSDYKNTFPARDEIKAWALKLANDQKLDLSGYDHVAVAMNVSTDLFGSPDFVGTVCCPAKTTPALLGQEMCHAYGLAHSRIAGSKVDYQDSYDIMSTLNAYTFAEMYGSSGPGMNAANMRAAGWLDESRVWHLPGGSYDATVTLMPLHRRDFVGFLAADLPGDFIAEFRTKKDWDAGIPAPTALIHSFAPPDPAESAYLGHSYLQKKPNGKTELSAVGDAFLNQIADLKKWLNVSVSAIDDRKVTLRVKLTATKP